MALWMVRTGRYGEFEQRFLDNNRVYLTWRGLDRDLSDLNTTEEFQALQKEFFPDQSPKAVIQYAGQMRRFVKSISAGDWVAVPSKHKPVIHIAEITGPYRFDPDGKDVYYHYRDVKWIAQDVPRDVFEQDLLYSLGAFSTVCQIKRNDAEARIRHKAKTGWKIGVAPPIPKTGDGGEEDDPGTPVDLEQLARDRISSLIVQKYKGHGLSRLVESVLKAQGYTTYLSPVGPDKGVDILAAPGAMGFGSPRLCVQVKSGDEQIGTPTLSQLIGTMQNVQADQGLFVAWGGFKSTVSKEVPVQFFRVRLWDRNDLIDALLEHYDQLEDDLRADLPLKRIWTVAEAEGETV